MNTQDIIKAIDKLRPNSEYTFKNNDYSTIEWIILEGNAPTGKEIETAIVEIKAEEEAASATAAATKAALLERLGITEAEAKLLLA